MARARDPKPRMFVEEEPASLDLFSVQASRELQVDRRSFMLLLDDGGASFRVVHALPRRPPGTRRGAMTNKGFPRRIFLRTLMRFSSRLTSYGMPSPGQRW